MPWLAPSPTTVFRPNERSCDEKQRRTDWRERQSEHAGRVCRCDQNCRSTKSSPSLPEGRRGLGRGGALARLSCFQESPLATKENIPGGSSTEEQRSQSPNAAQPAGPGVFGPAASSLARCGSQGSTASRAPRRWPKSLLAMCILSHGLISTVGGRRVDPLNGLYGSEASKKLFDGELLSGQD